MWSKRGAFIFCQTLTRSRSAPSIRPSSISTTSRRAPSVEYTVPISRPMMPPPTTSMRFGLWRSSSAPVEVTTRGSSFGRNGSFTASEPAAMMALLEADRLRAAVGHLDRQAGAGRRTRRVPCTHRHLAHLRHRGQAAGQLADHLFLVREQLAEVDRRRAERDAERVEVRDLVHHRGHVQQRLRRDAADVQADAAERRRSARPAPSSCRGRRHGTRPNSRPGRRRARACRTRGRRRPA